MSIRQIWLPSVLLIAGQVQAQDVELHVELMNQVSTQGSRKGDIVSARVLSPANLQGDVVEGKVTDSKSGAKMGGKSALSFTFDTLRHGGEAIAISSQVKSAANSKGQVDVDEEGRAVKRATGNLAKAAGGTGVGALIGGLAGGGKGAAIGAAVGGVGSIALIQVAADAPNITFAPGSKLILSANARGGDSLANLSGSSSSAGGAAPVAAGTPAPSAAAAPAPTTQPAARASAPSAPAAQSTPASAPQPDLKAIKSDFVPGEKTLFFDDFTDMAGDEPPPHWKVRGKVELQVGGNVRQLTTNESATTLAPNIQVLPPNFTFDALVKYATNGANNNHAHWVFFDKGGNELLKLQTLFHDDGSFMYELYAGDPRESQEQIGKGDTKANYAEPMRQSIWMQDGRVRLYLNGERMIDANQIKIPQIDNILLTFSMEEGATFGVRSLQIAESAPDFSKVISGTGRYVTHGILFDTDSDRLKPESAPVLKMVARGLEKNAALNLAIEGHTDAVGKADHNLDLSKRRAEAVKAVLVAQFGVDAARLSTDGLGATKPIDTNDTPQGRAQNRRVEFVKK